MQRPAYDEDDEDDEDGARQRGRHRSEKTTRGGGGGSAHRAHVRRGCRRRSRQRRGVEPDGSAQEQFGWCRQDALVGGR